MIDEIKQGDIVFYDDQHEAWMTNIITEVIEDKGNIAVIRTRGLNAPVKKTALVKLPVCKDFPIYCVAKYIPKHNSPD